MRYQEIFEARNAPIYHSTGFFNASQIIETNVILPRTTADLNGKEVKGVSFTRSISFARKWSDVILVFDQQKLMTRYSLVPRDYWGLSKNSPSPLSALGSKRVEAEEFIVGQIDNVNRYIIGIYISSSIIFRVATSDPNRTPPPLKMLIADPRFKGVLQVPIKSQGELMKA